jgi:hypothetical protein
MIIDESKLHEFLGRFVGDLGATVHAANVVIGDKLGLYKTRRRSTTSMRCGAEAPWA